MFHRMMNYGELDARPTVVLTKELIKKLMPKYRRHEDLLLVQEGAWDEFKRALPIPVVREENSPFSIDEDELASLVCQTVQKPTCRRLAVDKGVKNDDYRSPSVELILGDHGLVNHRDNHILYQFDITKCMFSFGNVHEKMRMAELDCSNEIVVDLFAGLGYFSLPLLVHAKAKHLYACEWNPDSIEALKKNLSLNKVEPSRYTVLEGDNRQNRPLGVAQRVLLGILPTCVDFMRAALECVDKKTGAILHCHDLVDLKPASVAQADTKAPTTPATTATTTTTAAATSGQYPIRDSQEEDASVAQNQVSIDGQSLFDQSITSSSSSHSTIERLSAPTSSSSDHDKIMTQSSESDKDTCSPVLLEKPASCSLSCQNSSNSSTELNNSNNSSNNSGPPNDDANANSNVAPAQQQSEEEKDESTELGPEQLPIIDTESSCYETRGLALIESIRGELESQHLAARIVHIQPVKSYAPHVYHVVFDIKIEPQASN